MRDCGGGGFSSMFRRMGCVGMGGAVMIVVGVCGGKVREGGCGPGGSVRGNGAGWQQGHGHPEVRNVVVWRAAGPRVCLASLCLHSFGALLLLSFRLFLQPFMSSPPPLLLFLISVSFNFFPHLFPHFFCQS